MNATHIFEELIQNHGYKSSPKHFGQKMMSLRMSSLDFPVSISTNEFNFMSEFVEENNLKRGYEIATGTGVSALAIGLGMKNGGKLVSMDSYIEENLGLDYNDEDKEVFVESRGVESVNHLVEKFGLTDVVFTKAGWSPDDTEKCIREVFNDPLDFVFIDALHDDKHFIQDIQAVVPLLADKFAIFMHDTHCLGEKSKNFLMDTFGKIWTYAENCRYPMGGWNLGYIENVVPKTAKPKRIRV